MEDQFQNRTLVGPHVSEPNQGDHSAWHFEESVDVLIGDRVALASILGEPPKATAEFPAVKPDQVPVSDILNMSIAREVGPVWKGKGHGLRSPPGVPLNPGFRSV